MCVCVCVCGGGGDIKELTLQTFWSVLKCVVFVFIRKFDRVNDTSFRWMLV